MPTKIVAWDVDDVICSRDTDLTGPEKYEHCQPVPDKIGILNECYDAGCHVVLYTSRGMTQFKGDAAQCDMMLREVTERKLAEWGVKYHVLIFGKIHFDLLIDNKVVNSDEINSFDDVLRYLPSE